MERVKVKYYTFLRRDEDGHEYISIRIKFKLPEKLFYKTIFRTTTIEKLNNIEQVVIECIKQYLNRRNFIASGQIKGSFEANTEEITNGK